MTGKAAILALALAFSVMAFAGINLAHAQWAAIGTGYAVTTDYHGMNIAPSTLVTVTAGTTDSNVVNVEFVWHAPDGTIIFTEIVAVTPLTTPSVPPSPISSEITSWASANIGVQYAYAQSAFAPNVLGDWGVQAIFRGPTGSEVNSYTEVIQIRATSFNVIPEVPLIGSAGASLFLLVGLGLYIKRKKV